MRRFLLMPLLVFLLASVPAAQEPKSSEPPAEVEAYPTLAPGHHVGEIRAMVFTPDGKRLITGGEDKTIQVWDVETRQRLRLFRPPVGDGRIGQILSLAVSPDGKTLAVGAYPIPGSGKQFAKALYLLNLADGRMLDLYSFSVGAAAVAFTRDGRGLVAGLGTRLVVFDDLGDPWGKQTTLPSPGRLIGGCPSYPVFSFSPTGDRLLVVNSQGKTNGPAHIWNLKTGGKTEITFQGVATVSGVWMPDSEHILTGEKGGPGLLRLWSTKGGEPIRTWAPKDIPGADNGNFNFIYRIVPVSKSRVVLLRFGKVTEIVLFDVETGKGEVLGKLTTDRDVDHRPMAVSSLGLVASPCAPQGQRFGLMPLERGDTRLGSGPAELERVTGWTANGSTVTLGRKTSKIQEVTTGLNLRTLERTDRLAEPLVQTTHSQGGVTLKLVRSSGLNVHNGEGRAIVPNVNLSSSYTLPTKGPVEWVAVGGYGGLALHSTRTGEKIRSFAPPGLSVRSVASSPDGKYLFASTTQGLAHLYNPNHPKPLLTVYLEDTDWIAWTEEGYYAASPNGERLIGWTINQGLNREANLLPAEQFRATLYRPDVIKLLLDKGSVAEALKAANAARKVGGIAIPRGVADPEKLLPPNVSLKIETKGARSVVTVNAVQGCKEQPIKSLRLLVDGRPLPGGVARVSYDTEKAEANETWTVELPPGKHRLSVLARSRDDTPSISSPVLVDTPLPPEMRPLVHHVAVGVSKYADDKLNLNFAEKDALDLAGAIRTSCAGTIYQKVETTSLTNAGAKREAVLAALDATRKVAKSTDLLILSFAGHGIREDGEFYLLTHEADTRALPSTTISGAALRAKLADYPCQVLLLLDACHSGAFVPLAKFRPATDEAARALADVEMRVAVMCAAQGHEEALEAKGNGHFTAAVIRALNRDPKAFFDLDTGELSVYHLQAFVSQEVSKATEYRQNPYLKMPLAHPPVIVTRFPMK